MGLVASVDLPTQKAPPKAPVAVKAEEAKNPLLGQWKSDEAVVEFKDDSNIVINGDAYKYAVKGNVLTVSNDMGALNFPFELEADTLKVEFQGRLVVYKRLKSDDKS